MATTRKASHPFQGGRKARPTQKHRPAVWECMLATVYAMNDAGEVQYFDYDWDAAREFAGISPERDLRIAKVPAGVRYGAHSLRSDMQPPAGRRALWVRET
jgi:hypothetical protein